MTRETKFIILTTCLNIAGIAIGNIYNQIFVREITASMAITVLIICLASQYLMWECRMGRLIDEGFMLMWPMAYPFLSGIFFVWALKPIYESFAS